MLCQFNERGYTNGNKEDLFSSRKDTGQRFGKLVVLKESEREKGFVMWECKCDCGKTIKARANSLLTGNTTTCGCGRIKAITKHRGTNTPLFNVWRNMKERCENKAYKTYALYGGRGIRLCDDWHDFGKFREWATANGYDETAKRGTCTIDRIDVNGDYEPSNCRWTTMKRQARNRRDTVFITYGGVRKSISDWADDLKIKRQTLYSRHRKGWSAKEILYGKI